MKIMKHEPTIRDVLEAVKVQSGRMDDVLDVLNGFSSSVDGRFSKMDDQFATIQAKMTDMEGEMTSMRSSMVTKDYLDEKLGDLRGDLVLLARKGNTKLTTLVEALVAERRLDPAVARRILALEPFPQP
jgi:hypothetical protein